MTLNVVISRAAILAVAAVAPFLSACGTAGMMSHYGATQHIDLHFTNRGEEIKGATCTVRNSEIRKNVTAPTCAAVTSSYSTLLIKCDAPGMPTGYVDADFTSGYPERIVVQAGIEKRYVYSQTNHAFHEVAVTSNQAQGQQPPTSLTQNVTRQFASASQAAQRAADSTRRMCESGPVQ